MKQLILSALAALASLGALLPARAQTTPPADWAVACGSKNGANGVTIDAQGNCYVSGTFSGTTTIGTTTLTTTPAAPGGTPPSDVFLTKLNAQGQPQWAVQLGNGQDAYAGQMLADNAGHLYLTGSFAIYSMQLGAGGPVLYNSSSRTEGFVACFAAATGQCQWARRFGGTGDDTGRTLALNSVGELFIAGQTGTGSADFGATTLPAAPSFRVRGFLAKLDATGNWQWARQLGNNGELLVGLMRNDGRGGLYMAGYFHSPSVTLGTTTLVTHQLTGWGYADGSDVFVAKFNEAGTVRWVVQDDATGTNNARGGGLAYDGLGHLFVAGAFNSKILRLGSLTLSNASIQGPQPNPAPPTPYTENFYSDAWVARLDTIGTWQWGARRGGAYDESAGIVSLVSTGQALVSVFDYMTPAYTLAALQPVTGAWLADYILPVPFGLVGDAAGRQYVWGSFSTSTLNLGGQVLANAGANVPTGFVARLSQLVLATRAPQGTSPVLQVWPTPGPGTGVWVQGAAAGQAVEVLDMLGRRVGGGIMPASSSLRLSWAGAGLAPSVYVVRSGERSTRWVVEE